MTDLEQLLATLTLDDRVRMLHQHAPEVPAAGLPAYRTGGEVLHGVAWHGVATVFPQAVGLASTWNEELLAEIGRAVAYELHAMRAENPALGLNVWAPVVNPLRNPRWGRNEEGYSEDPTLTARSAIAYTRGLRGPVAADAPWLTAPTLKHFVGYNSEDDRDLINSSLSARTFREYELPCFLGPLRAGSVAAVMASYNFVNGIPAHVSPVLDELRAELDDPDDIAIVSDAEAPSNLWKREGWSPDAAHGVAAVLSAGVDNLTDDIEDWRPSVEAFHRALDEGLITPELVDRAVRRLLRLRAKTGDLTAASYDGPPAEELRAQNRPLALRAATESVVLLENRSGALPLAAGTELAVIGPLAQRVLLDWYSGSLPYAATVADALAEWAPGTRIALGVDRVTLRTGDGFLAADASGALTLAAEPAGEAAEFELERWGSGVVTLRSAANGRFVTVSESGALGATAEAIGGWVVREPFVLETDAGADAPGGVRLTHRVSGKRLGVLDGRVALVEASDQSWSLDVVVSGAAEAAQAAAGRTAVVVVGNDPHLLGRETEDRPSVELPESTRELVAAAAQAAERTVLVIVSSYPYALGPVADLVDAVVWTSHGGQELGNAVRAVLTGEAEPRGRLTQSWPASDADVHELLDYDIVGSRQTYLYSTTAPAYPFGHGLHYSTTELTDAAVGVSGGASVAAGPLAASALDRPAAVVTATVRNTGSRPVAELVQLYVGADGEARRPFPRRRLVDWQRVELEPGASAELRFELPASALAQWDQRADGTGGWHIEPGAYRVFLGRSAEDVPVSLPLRAEGPAIAPLAAWLEHPVAGYDDASGAELVTDPASGRTAVRPRGARVRLRFVDVETGPQGRLELRARSGAAEVDLAVTAAASGAAASSVARASADGEASVVIPGIAAGELVDLELSWSGELALLSFRML